jgi:glycosyltransferase involved in cell wall biosynthesis
LRIAINGLAAKSEGALTYLLNLLPQFAKYGDQYNFIGYLNSKGATGIKKKLSETGIQFNMEVISGIERPERRILWEQISLPKLLRNNKIDVLFSPGPSVPLRCPCPAVIAIRNMEPYCKHVWPMVPLSERLRYSYLRWSTQKALRRTHRVILVSEATRSILLEYHELQPERTVVIHHGRDPSFHPIPKTEALTYARDWFGLKDPFILYVSKTRPYKNHIQLVKAFALVRSRWGREEHLVIAGEKQEPYFSKIIHCVENLKLSDYVHFLGDIPYELLPILYNACEVFVFTSTCEACPNIVIEAMACGLPMAVSDIPVIREFGVDAVMYFDPFDSISIANTLNELLINMELRSDLSKKALRRAQDFSWPHTAERTLEVIREAAKEDRHRLHAKA